MFHRNSLCRICLNETNEIVSFDSYLSDQINVGIHEALEKVMSLPLIINDVYPNQICRVCLGNLRISYELRIEYEKSESILMKCYKHVHSLKPETSSASVEVIFGSNKYDLKDLVIVEEPQTTEVNFGGFLNNLGQSISATFVNKKFEINSKQRSETPDISLESVGNIHTNKALKRSCKQRSKTPVWSLDNVTKNNSSVVKIRSPDTPDSINMGKIRGQFQFVIVDQDDSGSFGNSVILQSSQSCEEKNESMVEEHYSNLEIIEFENQSGSVMPQYNENLEVSSDKNKLIAIETKNKKYTNRESILIDQYIIQAENENLEIANELNKNDLIAVRRKGKGRNKESILIDQFIIEAENENMEIANEINKNDMVAVRSKGKCGSRESILIDQLIIEAKNENIEINNEISKTHMIAERTKGKCASRESILIDQYIIEAGNEKNKNLEVANDKNDFLVVGSKDNYASRNSLLIVQAESENLEINNETNKNGFIAVGSKRKNRNRDSSLIDQYIIEAGNNVEFDISEEPDIPAYLQLPNNTATDDELRQMETWEKQDANIPLTCKICKLKFQTRHSYRYHRLTKHSEQKYMCHFCARKFFTKGSLSRHILSHTDKTTVLCICPVCGKTFNYKGGLFYHMKQHTNERNYCCDHCNRRFYTSSAKKRHQSTHTGYRPYSCSACNKKFFSSGELHKHKYRHTVERPHHCEFCGKGFTSRFNMNIHMFSHPGDFICELCNRGFVTGDVLKSHYRTKHKSYIVEEAGNS